MVTILRIQDVDYEKYSEVWAIVRSLKYANPKIKHVPELSPSWGLFNTYLRMKENGQWNEETFRKVYVPQFLKEMKGKEQQRLMNELFSTTKSIALVCFCPEEELCHRSIIGGMLQGAGLDVKGLHNDYSYYFDWYKNGVPGAANPGSDVQDIEPEHNSIEENNSNVTRLYEMDKDAKDLFDDGVPSMCFTGRRPKDLCGYDSSKYNGFVRELADAIYDEFYVGRGIRRYVTGGAQGFDQMAFWAVARMIKLHDLTDVENIVFVPFKGQELRWAEKGLFSQTEYWQMIEHATKVVIVCSDNSINALFIRNEAMCDSTDICLALYPDDNWKDSKGGTASCMRYAMRSKNEVFRLGYTVDKMGLKADNIINMRKTQ